MQVSDFVRIHRFRVVSASVQSQLSHARCRQTSRMKLTSGWPSQKYWASVSQARRTSKLCSLLLMFPQVSSNNPFSERNLSYLGWNPGVLLGFSPVCDSRRGVSWFKCALQKQKCFLCYMPAAWLFFLTMAIFVPWEIVTVVCIHYLPCSSGFGFAIFFKVFLFFLCSFRFCFPTALKSSSLVSFCF